MKINKENLENYETALTIEVEEAELEKAKKKACKDLANRYNFPGFRKGKAPQQVIERQLGKEYIEEEAIDRLVQEQAAAALKEENLSPVTEPKAEIVSKEEGKPFVFKITFTPYPEVKLGDYKGLEAEKHVKEVTDEDVDKQIEIIRDHHATLIETDSDATVENGDFITLDFKGYMNDVAFEGGEGRSHPLTIGSGTFIPGFEDQLIGLKAGEEKDVKVTFPEDYHEPKFAGKDAVFKCKIITLKHKELPELNDEFAKKISKFETFEEYKADIKKNLEASADRRAEEERNQALVEKAVENMTVDLPPVMVETYITQLINEFSHRLQMQGSNLENYMQYSGLDMDQLRESYKESATKELLTEMMLEEVAKQEDIKATQEELNYEIAVMAATYRTTPKQVVKILREQKQLNTVAATVRRRKCVKFIIDNAKK